MSRSHLPPTGAARHCLAGRSRGSRPALDGRRWRSYCEATRFVKRFNRGASVMTRTLSALDDLAAFTIEVPSWAYGNSGTRFKVFPAPGVPRDPYEKIADAAQV